MTWRCDQCDSVFPKNHDALQVQDGSMLLFFCDEDCKQAFYDDIVSDAKNDAQEYA